MARLLSTSAGDISSWRAAADFVASYRRSLLEHAASDRFGTAETLFEAARVDLERHSAEDRAIQNALNGVLAELAAHTDLQRLKQLTSVYYGQLYHQMDLFHSAPAFYQGSMRFLRQISATLVHAAAGQLETESGQLPPLSLIALGPAGRSEYSPYCPLQLALLHGETDSAGYVALARFGEALHAGFDSLGLRIDPLVSPRNPQWRGSMDEWQQRCTGEPEQPDDEVFIDQMRLADQCQLTSADALAGSLKNICMPLLRSNRPALSHLVERMAALSNGLGLMGRLKLERHGPGRGQFQLLEHGLLPLSSAVSALAVISGSLANSTPDRVRELLASHLLDVDAAERMLMTWHTLHELRLLREGSYTDAPYLGQPVFLNPTELQLSQRLALKEGLESVAVIQRQVVSTFSGIEA